ncbi:tRNA(Ile)-lysidine synthetase [Cellulomonas flavigena DSM 20109]|uniref:tRNA(Ile)-lysidine synthase n=1 Tax=Cellulomonas flavigena (strain ATCC 482 / DSM 20109 / BCRC 11376 / JCM 18109 / NBRC 3775 / NCIMB 8073 / NRS 134) TaxID=446466 RepID=D5UIN8_CELFN|nr:tRNA lysidine(34) synthetase TilS [Cellulomonas flavigena]ADG73537.1 tRNA(Ile)-lysidine synthetase [Cellulomonas flavigena DSM 20109]
MSGPSPAVAAVRVAVRRALADVPPGATVLVACSGGADSLALAAGLAWEAQDGGWRAGAVVVDHGLQDGSHDVAQEAAAACRRLGLDPVRVVRVDVGTAGGPEAAARSARYAALDAAADELDATAVLLGHTLDDQAETVLLALARGSGERALAGMRPVRGRLRRPLLALRRTDTEAACADQGLDPWHDPTNGRHPTADVPAGLPLRSRVRTEVLPVLEDVLGPGVAQALARTADALADAADALDQAAARVLAAAWGATREMAGPGAVGADRPAAGEGQPGPVEPLVLDVGPLADAPAAVRRRALHDAAVRAGCPPGALARVHVLAVESLVTRWRGQGPVHLPGGRTASRACGRLYLGRPDADGGPDAGGGRPPGDPGRRTDGHDDQE